MNQKAQDKKKARDEFVAEVHRLYQTMGTLEISYVLDTTQAAVFRVLEGTERRDSLEERRLNREYKEKREKDLNRVYCPICGGAYPGELSICDFCKGEVMISDHDAWLSFESGWFSRNLCGSGGK